MRAVTAPVGHHAVEPDVQRYRHELRIDLHRHEGDLLGERGRVRRQLYLLSDGPGGVQDFTGGFAVLDDDSDVLEGEASDARFVPLDVRVH
ncbi:hypothetical protein OOK53_06490 [Streptomyces anulatus]|nr:hypothetical protein [Streptomyces anulatus]